MKLKFGGKPVMRTGQRLSMTFRKPKSTNKREDTVKVNLSQKEQGRWSRLLQLVQIFFDEQLAISGKPDFQLQTPPQTELTPLSEEERAFLNDLFRTTATHFQTGAEVSSVDANAKNKEFVQATIERMNQEKRERLSAQPDPPPAVLLAPTPTRKCIEEHYQKPGTIKTNVNGVQGMESYEPPPVILSAVEKGA